ncbi:unnamed protein product, partial [Amoebophrya sp. A25]
SFFADAVEDRLSPQVIEDSAHLWGRELTISAHS